MKNRSFLVKLIAILAILLSAGCQKIMDYWPNHPPPDYRIKTITFNDYGVYTGNFFYNKWGNPDSVKFGRVGTGLPNYLFSYNKKKQLREIKETYLNGQYEKWHKLGMNNKGQIIVDTVYIFGSLDQDPEPSNYWNKRIESFEYDVYGRIVKFTDEYIVPVYPPNTITYTYNADGNLVKPFQTYEYDNQRNLLTLHPIWQFLQKDYSLNNPIPAVSYNSYKLPLQFAYPVAVMGGKFPFFSGRKLDIAEIVYELK